MFHIDSPFPPGTIGIISHELSRYSDFCTSLVSLKAPAGTVLLWNKGVEIAAGLNNIIRKMTGEWVWIMGDDHTFKDDVLMSLLATNKDVVVPICSGRTYPHFPVIFKEALDGGYFVRFAWEDIPQAQVFEVVAAGNAGMLIKKHVLDTVGDPWFEAGRTQKEHIGEDLNFCNKLRAAGIKIHATSKLGIGHITPATIWPAWFEKSMIPMANFNGNEEFWVRLDTGYAQEAQK